MAEEKQISRCYAALVLAIAAMAGCDRAPAGAPAPATPTRVAAPSTLSASTRPATTQAAETMINIDGTMVLFPPAKVRLDEADGRRVARLFSDDPKHALEENYDGNSFYLQLELDDASAQGEDDLAGTALTYRSPTTERDDSPYGIFLEGRRWVLQPADVRVVFDADDSASADGTIGVRIDGEFLLFDSDNEATKPKRATIAAQLPAAVQARK